MSEAAATGGLDTSAVAAPLRQVVAGLAAVPAGRWTLALWEDQRGRWQRGERVPVESYLEALPAPAPPDLVVDLVYGEFVLRQEAGEAPTVEEYLTRFPDRAADIRRQLGVHESLSGAEPASASPETTTTVGAAATDATHEAHVPAELAGYRVIAALQSGGQGTVYRGVHPALGREVVIKVGHAEAGDAADALVSEGRILAELDHPGLARVFDLRMHEGRPCLVMEYVRGADLHQQAKRQPYSPAEAAALVARVARALAVAHRRGVVHRDLKPRNILIDEAGNPRVIDFGLALLEDAWRRPEESPGVVSGTVSYMAPEQARGEPATVRSDVFGLGGVLFFLLSGHAPYPGGGFYDILVRASTGEWDQGALDGRAVPPRLRAVVERALAPNPADRFASAEEMALALETVARPTRRGRWLAVAGAAALLALGGVLLWAAWPGGHTTGAADPTGAARPEARRFELRARVERPPGHPGFVDLTAIAPVLDDDAVRVESVAPAGMHVALFHFKDRKPEEEKLKLLTAAEPADEDRPLSYPEQADKTVTIEGKPGNELVLMVARRSGSITKDDLRDLLAGEWPQLPAHVVLQMSPREVKARFARRPGDGPEDDVLNRLTDRSRDFGKLRDRPDPEGEARRRLEELRTQLRSRFDHFEVLMFSHRAGHHE
jgi:predicted Ser/Thr protein kinase